MQADGLHPAMEGKDRVPDTAAFEVGGRRGEQPRDLAHLLVLAVERVQ